MPSIDLSGGCLVLDPKGQHARKPFWRRQPNDPRAKTTGYHFRGVRVYLLDPFREWPDLPSMRFNPFAEIDSRSDSGRNFLSAKSDACVVSEDPRNQHFTDTAAARERGDVDA